MHCNGGDLPADDCTTCLACNPVLALSVHVMLHNTTLLNLRDPNDVILFFSFNIDFDKTSNQDR